MKHKFFIIFALLLIINFSKSFVDPSYYSKLLGKVRKNIVEQSLLSLPKRNVVNYLQMFNQIAYSKEKYSLTNADSAYLIYKWIATNIVFEPGEVNQDPVEVYNSGKGTSYGISSLFKKMCNYLSLESNIISGYFKTGKTDNLENIIIKIDFTWNSILIDNTNYLIDISNGAGVFDLDENEFIPLYTDFYFGTNPEFFIRDHFPKDSRWQLLSEPYSLEKFESQAYLTYFFYLKGFKNISPDVSEISGSGQSKIVLDYDKSITDLEVTSLTIDFINDDIIDFNEVIVSNGKIEVKFNLEYDKIVYLVIIVNEPSIIGGLVNISFYKLNSLTKLSSFLNIKKEDIKHSKAKKTLNNILKKNILKK